MASGDHYAKYDHATVEMFRDLWRRQVKEEMRKAESSEKGITLFLRELLVLLFGPLMDRCQR